MRNKIIYLTLVILILPFAFSQAADPVGCCINPAAAGLSCNSNILSKQSDCCPDQQQNPSYYRNEDGFPSTQSFCISNFFKSEKSCTQVSECVLGCCCTPNGGEYKPQGMCAVGQGTSFKLETCEQANCRRPQCNDGLDNDNNGCRDFSGGDTGCTTSSDDSESGGSCYSGNLNCLSSEFIPVLIPVSPGAAQIPGQKKISLAWRAECPEGTRYNIYRCRGSNCRDFAEIVSDHRSASFIDDSLDLQYSQAYTYKIQAVYTLQSAKPTIQMTATIGDEICASKTENQIFCHQNQRARCTNNRLVIIENCGSLSQKVCVEKLEGISCIAVTSCDQNGLFGLFGSKSNCEGPGKYCYYDRSEYIVDLCYSCNPRMSCYDYKTKQACSENRCGISNCRWKPESQPQDQIEKGVCISTSSSNCQYCSSSGISENNVLNFCTQEKVSFLSTPRFECFLGRDNNAMDCATPSCPQYTQEQCRASDPCSIGKCVWSSGLCSKDTNPNDNALDCDGASDKDACEKDYFSPLTSLQPAVTSQSNAQRGSADILTIRIADKITRSGETANVNPSAIGYKTYLCSGESCIPSSSTTGRTLIIRGLDVYDPSANFVRLFSMQAGNNKIRYRSEDPSKNLEDVKETVVYASSENTAPMVKSRSITQGSEENGRLYTKSKNPSFIIEFYQPASIVLSRIKRGSSVISSFPLTTQAAARYQSPNSPQLSDGNYIFEMNARSSSNQYMASPLALAFVVDTTAPRAEILPKDTIITSGPFIPIRLTFSEEVNLNSVKLNNDELKENFTTTDDKVFNGQFRMKDGIKKLEVSAADYATNSVSGVANFEVDAEALNIALDKPKFGAAPSYNFEVAVITDNAADCKYYFDTRSAFESATPFESSDETKTTHTISAFTRIANGDKSKHKLGVSCKDSRRPPVEKVFDIWVDDSKPNLLNVLAYPAVVADTPMTSSIKVESDDEVICKYSSSSKPFEEMESKFDNYDKEEFKTINLQQVTVQSQGDHKFYVACKNRAGLASDIKEAKFKADLNAPMEAKSHTSSSFKASAVTLALEVNKVSTCYYSTNKNSIASNTFGPAGYYHTRTLNLAEGKFTYYAQCKTPANALSNIVQIDFYIDTSAPTVSVVDDSSDLQDKPQSTWDTKKLRVKWKSEDLQSSIVRSYYTLVQAGTNDVIVNWTPSEENDKFITVTKSGSTGLNLENGKRYLFRVKSENSVGLVSEVKESDGITVDTSLKPSLCSNNIKDSGESDVDCGGTCGQCDSGKKCLGIRDCKSGICNNGICAASSCSDSVKAADEADVDCGGVCTAKCAENKKCYDNKDCTTEFCNQGLCKPRELCTDGRFSPIETDIDCGGTCPAKCKENKSCASDSDCDVGLGCSPVGKCSKTQQRPPQEQTPGQTDTDLDGMPDEWEVQNGLNPQNAEDANEDADKDGLSNLEEFSSSTNPNSEDSDGDGVSDKYEIDNGSNPNDPLDFPESKSKAVAIFMILGIIILVSGFGFLAFRAINKRKETGFEASENEITFERDYKPMPASKPKIVTPMQKAQLKKKEFGREKEMHSLFSAFGEEKKEAKKPEEKPAEKAHIEKQAVHKKPEAKKEMKPQIAKKEDVFSKLKEIASEKKKSHAKGKSVK